MNPKAQIILFNKPFNVLSQFTDSDAANSKSPRQTLANYIDVPNVYVAGRLDRDSEGLLVLTNDGKLQHRISDPQHKMSKCYWVQIEGIANPTQLAQLRQGIDLNDGPTLPAKVKVIVEPSNLWPRQPPIRTRQTVPDSWLSITITEGRNRQVRRMTAAVGLPTLRLIRYRVGSWTLDSLDNGEWRRL